MEKRSFNRETLPRCGAKARSNDGKPCRQIAMENGRCYWHGGVTKIKHGRETKMAHAERTRQRLMINAMRDAVTSLEILVDERVQGKNDDVTK